MMNTAGAPDIEVRAITSVAEYHACVALQAEVWGPQFDRVPATLLQVATYVGGMCLGAFSPDGEIYGFVFGLAGTLDGRPIHWSHLLAVKEGARNLGIGRRLKEHQREVLAKRGITEMCWTFDPMIAKNAHINLNLLGARVLRYVPDMYGTTDSPLHHGLATDRLLVACTTAPQEASMRPPIGSAATPILTYAPQGDDDLLARDGIRAPSIRIEVPTDFRRLAMGSPDSATGWHTALRAHFVWALDAGYVVTGLQRDPLSSRSFYMLQAQA